MACRCDPNDALMMIEFDNESGCVLIVCSCTVGSLDGTAWRATYRMGGGNGASA
jgi:hypothetical protein